MVDLMELGHMNGNYKVQFMKEILKMEWDMGRENGRGVRQNIMVHIYRV
jgi:hypothetical protein